MMATKGTMKYYTVNEIAEMLKVNRFTVYRWIREEKLKRTVVGDTVRISQEDLDNFINKK